jgi:hypothetical protein
MKVVKETGITLSRCRKLGQKKIEYETKKTTLKKTCAIELLYKQKFSKFSLDDPAEPRQESK